MNITWNSNSKLYKNITKLEPWDIPKCIFPKTVESLIFDAPPPFKPHFQMSRDHLRTGPPASKYLQNLTPNAGVQKCNPKTKLNHKV